MSEQGTFFDEPETDVETAVQALVAAGAVPCERCGVPCRVAASQNPDARLLRKSVVAEGWCVNCAATDFLKTTEPLGELIEGNGPDCLRLPHIQDQFASIMRVGLADAQPDELDWETIIANWALPFPEGRRGRKRKAR